MTNTYYNNQIVQVLPIKSQSNPDHILVQFENGDKKWVWIDDVDFSKRAFGIYKNNKYLFIYNESGSFISMSATSHQEVTTIRLAQTHLIAQQVTLKWRSQPAKI